MFSISDLAAWFADPVNWDGRYGLWFLLAEHVGITLAALLIAAIVALPLGLAIGHTGKGEFLVIGLGSISRAVPTMGLLFALVLLWGVQLRDVSLLVALAAIAIPPLLAGAYAGVTTIPWGIRDSAKAQGMTGFQRVRYVEFPLATSSIIGGMRIAFIQVVSTVVLAPLVGLGGLGFGIVQGLALRNYSQVVASSLVIIVITIVGSQLLGWLQQRTDDRLKTPPQLGDTMKLSRFTAMAVGLTALVGLAGCAPAAPSSSETIVIGSQAYYSNEIIAEVYAQVLEDAGYTVERQFSLGQRDVYIPALEAGEIDLFPEYTGNLLQFFDPAATETAADDVYAALGSALPAGLTALAMSPATDQDSYNVTKDFADANSLVSIEDLAKVMGLKLGGAPELAERPYGPSGLLSVYGVTVEFQATGETTVDSLVAGIVDMANVYSADPRIEQLGLVTLSDPLGLFLASNVVPIASEVVSADARALIDKVSAAMSAADLVAMNVRSVDEKLSASVIAKEWLVSKGLLKK